jgi:hypothetical protein
LGFDPAPSERSNQEAEMRRTLLALPVVIFMRAGIAVPTSAAAQAAKKTRGTVTAINPTTVTLKVASATMNFAVDEKTKVEAPGAGTATRRAAAAGKPGMKLDEVIKTGDAVEVSYHDVGGKMQASMIRKVSSPGKGPADDRTSDGKVTAVTANSLTISGSSGGGASFTQTFVIDTNTRVIGKGAGTAAAKQGGKVAATDLVANGDTVHVSFRDMQGTLHAKNIRVMAKAAK